jgi:hypothetical protein
MKENIAIGILLLIVFFGSALFYRCLMACCIIMAYKDANAIRSWRRARKEKDVEMGSVVADAGVVAV